MTGRLVHQRTKGPASTPAQRLVELQNALSAMERERDEARAERDTLGARLARFHSTQETSFGNIQMAQQWADLTLWEYVLNANPQLQAIFEIGTWKGGFSWWLYAQSLARDIYFQTYDAVPPEQDIPAFYRADVFAETAFLGKRFRAFEPCLVYCDGGNKPRELNTFAGELRDPGSLLVVHDWGAEIGTDDVPDSVVMLYGEFFEEVGSITRVFRLKETDA